MSIINLRRFKQVKTKTQPEAGKQKERNMEMTDFKKAVQEQIEKGLSTAKISDQKAADKILALVPQEWITNFFSESTQQRKPLKK